MTFNVNHDYLLVITVMTVIVSHHSSVATTTTPMATAVNNTGSFTVASTVSTSTSPEVNSTNGQEVSDSVTTRYVASTDISPTSTITAINGSSSEMTTLSHSSSSFPSTSAISYNSTMTNSYPSSPMLSASPTVTSTTPQFSMNSTSSISLSDSLTSSYGVTISYSPTSTQVFTTSHASEQSFSIHSSHVSSLSEIEITSTIMSAVLKTSTIDVTPSELGSLTNTELINATSESNTSSLSTSVNDTSTPSITPTSSFEGSITTVQPTASSVYTTSTTAPTSPDTTTPPTTTTTSTTTTLKYLPVKGDTDAATFKVSFRLTFFCDRYNVTAVKSAFEKKFLSVTLTAVGEGCANITSSRRKRDANQKEYEVTTIIAGNSVGSVNSSIEESLQELNTSNLILVSSVDMDDVIQRVSALTSNICEADNYCPLGYNCAPSDQDFCYFMCENVFEFDCGDHGNCVVEVGYNTSEYIQKCRCRTDQFYQYTGEKCGTKEMTWQMILAIAGGSAAAIIVILVVIIIITCIRKKRQSNGYNKYLNGDDLHYMDLQENRSTERHYQGLRPAEDRGNARNAQGYENKAYDYRDYIEAESDLHYRTGAPNGSRANGSRSVNGSHNRNWNPDDSADVYAKLNNRFDDMNHQYNIKRAQLRKSGNDSDVRTGF